MEDERLIPDNYIGKDIFEERVREWLEFFAEEDKEIFLELLKCYRYFTRSQFRRIIFKIHQTIIEKTFWGVEQNSVLFITFPSKQGVASGGDTIRAIFEQVST